MDTSLPTTLRQLKTIIGRRPPRDVRQRFNRLRDRLLRSGRDHMLTPADVAWVTFGGNNDTSSALRGGIDFKKIVLAALAAIGLAKSDSDSGEVTLLDKIGKPNRNPVFQAKRMIQNEIVVPTFTTTKQWYSDNIDTLPDIGFKQFKDITVQAKLEENPTGFLNTCVVLQAKNSEGIVPLKDWKSNVLKESLAASIKYIIKNYDQRTENMFRYAAGHKGRNEFAACFGSLSDKSTDDTSWFFKDKEFTLEPYGEFIGVRVEHSWSASVKDGLSNAMKAVAEHPKVKAVVDTAKEYPKMTMVIVFIMIGLLQRYLMPEVYDELLSEGSKYAEENWNYDEENGSAHNPKRNLTVRKRQSKRMLTNIDSSGLNGPAYQPRRYPKRNRD